MKLQIAFAVCASSMLSACLVTDTPFVLSGDMPLEQRYWQMCAKTPDEPKYVNCYTASVEPYSEGNSSGWALAYYPTPGYLETHSFEAHPMEAAVFSTQESPSEQYFFVQMTGNADNRGFALKNRTSFGFAKVNGTEIRVRVPECDAKDIRRASREFDLPLNDGNPCDITSLGYSLNETAVLLRNFKKTKFQLLFTPMDDETGARKFVAERDGRG